MQGKLRKDGDMNLVKKYDKAATKLADIVEKIDKSFFNQFDLGPHEV